MKNRFPREFYVPKGAVKVADKQSSAVAYLYESTGPKGPRWGAVCFQGKADKPSSHYTFRDSARRETHIAEHFGNVRAHEKRRLDNRAEAKAFVHTVQVGDIFRTSWGYDQTNVEFFQVVEVKGKHAILREIGCASVSRGMGCDSVVAQSGAFLKGCAPLRRLIQKGGFKISQCRWASPWGKRGPGGIVIGEACHATAAGWGH